MYAKRTAQTLIFLGASTLLVGGLTVFTYDAGRGKCNSCGHNAHLSACKHCGWAMCLRCWQTKGKYNCPNCERDNP